jgi:cytochrome oxidase Cu insertion factor (SCO1/SenC/PrrC family)
MALQIKRFNSKGFLLLYLVVFACLLSLWLFRMQAVETEHRDIPPPLKPLVVSPAKTLPQFLLHDSHGGVLTDQSLKDKWSFIYFTHPACQPQCEPVLDVMQHLRSMSASPDIQFLLINFDAQQHIDTASKQLDSDYGLPIYFADKAMIEKLSEAFAFLFLRTELERGYSLEQQHSLFLTDPKGRVYARFEPPYTSVEIQSQFLALRDFYARSE